MTPEREKEIRDLLPLASRETKELLAEIDRLNDISKKSLEWGLHEGNRVANAAADRHTELVFENKELLAEIDRLRGQLQFRNDTQVTGYCIRCEEIQPKYEALEKERDQIRAQNEDNNLWRKRNLESGRANFLRAVEAEKKLAVAEEALKKIAQPCSMVVSEDLGHECELYDFWHRTAYTRLDLASEALSKIRGEK